MAKLRVLIAGGGTGGHIIPALAVARELVARHKAEVLFVGTARGMESRLVPEAGFNLRLVEVGQLKNVSLMTRLRTMADLPRSIFACKRLIRMFQPNVVFGVGGYASGPAMAAAALVFFPKFPGSGTVADCVLLLLGLGGLYWMRFRRRKLIAGILPVS